MTEPSDAAPLHRHPCCLMCLGMLAFYALIALGIVLYNLDLSVPEIPEIPVNRTTISTGAGLIALVLLAGLIYSLRIDPYETRRR